MFENETNYFKILAVNKNGIFFYAGYKIEKNKEIRSNKAVDYDMFPKRITSNRLDKKDAVKALENYIKINKISCKKMEC
jgi:hypothetical protein